MQIEIDKSRLVKKTEYEGGCSWHIFSYPTLSDDIVVIGENSDAVMKMLTEKFNEWAAGLSAHQRLAFRMHVEQKVEPNVEQSAPD